MKLIVDCQFGQDGLPIGYVHLDTSDPVALQTLKNIQSGAIDIQKSGWAEVSKLPGLPPNTTRWNCAVNSASGPYAPPELTALGLTHNIVQSAT
jgi:hypothetical protein